MTDKLETAIARCPQCGQDMKPTDLAERQNAVALELLKEQAAKVCDGRIALWRYAIEKNGDTDIREARYDEAGCIKAELGRALPTSPYAAEVKRIIEDAARWRETVKRAWCYTIVGEFLITTQEPGPGHEIGFTKAIDEARRKSDAARQEDKT